MKKLLVLVLTMISLCKLSFSQTPVTRLYDLSKYSYPIFIDVEADSINSNTGERDTFYYTGHGTCFFIRKSNRLFLVTAYHVFAFKPDMAPGHKIKSLIGGMARINYYPEHPEDNHLRIMIDKSILNSDDINVMINPDLFVFELPAKEYDSPYINSIEGFLPKDKNEVSSPLLMYSYGFPSIRFLKDIVNFTNTDPDSPSYVIPYAGKLKMDVADINEKANWLLPHPSNMHSKFKVDSLNYVANPKYAQGASGSPVFFYSTNNGQINVWFAGIVSTISPVDDFTIIVKEEYIMNELENLMNSGKQYTIIPGVK
jgi:hypothetical protein